MIPKIIHYCWFGRTKKPELVVKCINSWKKKCPEYEIIEWNEENYDISTAPLYVRQAYAEKKWAFVSDYVRLWIIYQYGGIYLDTDCELKKSFANLLRYDGFFGKQENDLIATGLGFGAIKNSRVIKEMLDCYEDIPFIKEDGSYDLTVCLLRNTPVLYHHGLKKSKMKQVLSVQNKDLGIQERIIVLPPIYFNPIDRETGFYRKSIKTISVHRYANSWLTIDEKQKKIEWLRYQKELRRDRVIHAPNRLMKLIVTEKGYNLIKKVFKKSNT